MLLVLQGCGDMTASKLPGLRFQGTRCRREGGRHPGCGRPIATGVPLWYMSLLLPSDHARTTFSDAGTTQGWNQQSTPPSSSAGRRLLITSSSHVCSACIKLHVKSRHH